MSAHKVVSAKEERLLFAARELLAKYVQSMMRLLDDYGKAPRRKRK